MPLTYGIVVRCRNRASVDVGLNVRIGVTVSVPSDKVHVVVVFTKNVFCGQSRLTDCLASRKPVVLVSSKSVQLSTKINRRTERDQYTRQMLRLPGYLHR